MDLNYNIESMDFSLRTMSMVKLTSGILTAVGLVPGLEKKDKVYPFCIASRACEEIEKLELPITLKTDMKNITEVIMLQMLFWFKKNPGSTSLVFTPQGAVDFMKSARALFHSDLKVTVLFKKACKYCLEDEILKFGRSLSFEDKLYGYTYNGRCLSKSRTLPRFWLNVYKDGFRVKINLENLTDDVWTVGLRLALKDHNSIAIKFFMQKASRQAIQQTVMECADLFTHSKYQTSPATYVALFTKLNENQRNIMKEIFSFKLLIALLSWPYQNLFLVAAKTLTSNLAAESYLTVATYIAQKAATNQKDHNYRGLFLSFWELGSDQRSNFDINSYDYTVLMRLVLMMKNDHIVNVVYRDTVIKDIEESPTKLIAVLFHLFSNNPLA